jgi:hypothetical protein
LLPRRYEQEQLSWETTALVDTQWPAEWPPAKVDLKNYRLMTKLADDYRVELRSIERGVGNGSVLLADYSFALNSDGSSISVAAFDLELAGAANCLLELPAGSELISVRLDRARAQLSPLAENRWNIWFGDSSLPRRLDVIYSQRAHEGRPRRDVIMTPILVDLPIERSLWTIDTPASLGSVSPHSGTAIAPAEHALLRVECTANLLKSADRLLAKEPGENVGSWYLPWAERLRFRRTAAERSSLDLPAEAEPTTASRLTAIDSEQLDLARRLGTQDVLEQSLAGSQAISEPTALFESLQPDGSVRSHIMLAGNGNVLEIDFPERMASHPRRRMLAAIAVGLVGAAISISLRRKNFTLGDVPYLPPAVGAVAGLAWWLWLAPAILGPILVILCAVSAWHVAQSRSLPLVAASARGSTVTRVFSSERSSQFRARPR